MSKGARFKVEYEVVVRDKKGKVLHRERRTSKSLLTFFIRWLRSFLATVSGTTAHPTFSATDTGGVARTIPLVDSVRPGGDGAYLAGVNIADFGLVVGLGTTAVSPADTRLESQCLQGTGTSQFVHGACTIEDYEVVGAVSRVRTTRTFTNNSGASITVREIGGYVCCFDTGPVARYFCYLRDVLVSPSTVPDGASLTVRYRFSVTA